jgi:hypothetical protein
MMRDVVRIGMGPVGVSPCVDLGTQSLQHVETARDESDAVSLTGECTSQSRTDARRRPDDHCDWNGGKS